MKNILNAVLTIVIVGALFYTVHGLSALSNRIQKIENKLGGPEKIACNEKDAVEKVRRSVVRIVGGESEGSGFAVKKNGIILTNFHVIEFEPNPKVIFPDNTFETAEVIMADKNADLAVVKVSRQLPPISWANLNKLGPAEELLAIGFPLGGELSGEASVNRGLLSSRRQSKAVGVEYLQTDMTLVPGVSGGPMVNICGELVGINTAGFISGGMGFAISADSIRQKWNEMAASKEPLKDVQRIVFQPDKNALEAVRAFYNYLKARKMEKAFTLLSNNFVKGYSFEQWKKGYQPLLDTTVMKIEPDEKMENRIRIKLSTKDFVVDEIVYKYFEGYWDVRQIDGRWLLWNPRIREVKDPDLAWIFDLEQEEDPIKKEVREFAKTHADYERYRPDMYRISLEPENAKLSLQELYDMAKAQQAVL